MFSESEGYERFMGRWSLRARAWAVRGVVT